MAQDTSLNLRATMFRSRPVACLLSLTASEPQADDRSGEATSIPALLEPEDCALVAWYRYVYAPRTGGAYDSHHRTAGIAGLTGRRGCSVAARSARAADEGLSNWCARRRQC